MTLRAWARGRVHRWVLAGVVGAGVLGGLSASTLAAPPASAPADPLVENLEGGASIDWRVGVLTVTGAAAAELRMPSAASARARAERAARQAAITRLGALLRQLPLARGRHLEADAVARTVARAAARVQPGDLDYASNGGATMRLTARFGDWSPGPPVPAASELVLSMVTCRLQAAPTLVVPGHPESPPGGAQTDGAGTVDAREARYRLASTLPAGTRTVRARLDGQGRVVLGSKEPSEPSEPSTPSEPARGDRSIVIYCDKVAR
jgi:hypothetical protein